MKTISRIFIATLLMVISYVSNAQGINFQGVSRSANGTILANSNISLRLSIMSKSVDAAPEYIEIKKVVTNAQGIFSIVIGDAVAGSTTGTFSSINWANAPKFLKVEMDPSGGTSYINMGITQLQYVPYSFYSLGVAAENVTGVLPVEKGGTGVGSLADLKTALKITTIDTTSLSNRIDGKMSSSNTTFSSDITVNGLTVGLGGGQSNNTALGKEALKSNTTGTGNTAVGVSVLKSNTTGANNAAFGGDALKSNTIGYQNAAFGNGALGLNTTGENNNAFGFVSQEKTTTGRANSSFGSESMRDNTTGSYNAGFGNGALWKNTTGANNTAVGYQASSSNTTGYNNTAVGQGSLLLTTEGPNNVAVGVSALKNNVVGSRNVAVGVGAMEANLGSVNNAVGYFAMKKNTTGDANNAFGHQALEQNTTGVNNAAFGHSALGGNIIGNGNAAFGYGAAGNNKSDYNAAFGMGALGTNQNGSENAAFGSYAITNATGSKLTAVGAKAGESNSTGINNTYIGAYANTSTGTISNSTAIGYNAQVTASNQIQLGNANVTMVKSAGVLTSSRGLLPPKFSAVERDAIVDPEQGLTIYCYNCGTYGELQVFNGNAWVNAIGSATAAITDVTAGLVASFPLDGTAAGTNTSTSTQISTVTKAMTTAWTYTLPATDPNKTYKMVVSGTWGIANGRAHRDAAYDANSNNTIGSTGTPVANRGCDANWVFEGNCAPPAPTSPSGYASNNTYEYYLGNGKSGGYSLAFTDGSYGDNVGSLTFTLYEVGIAGSTTGTVTYTTNRKGTANSAMQGGAGYITAPSSIFQFTRTQAFTVSVWFTADAVESSGRLLSTENAEGHFRISKYDLNNIAVQYGDYITQTVTNNVWHHLVYTYNNRLEKVYMDGVLVQTNTDTSTEALSYGAPFTIGAKAASAFDMWAGKIDDVKVYNRALLPNEVLVLFNQ